LEDVEGVQRKGIDSVDGLIRDLGMILVYLHREETQQQDLPTPMYTSQLLDCIQAAACRIAVCAVARGWFATLKVLLPATMAFDHSEEAAMNRMNELCPQSLGGNLLHVAVGTGSVETVRVLGEWTRFEKGSPWSIVGRATAGGVSPLHVAAMLPLDAGQRMLVDFAKWCPKLDEYWANTFADDGSTPQQLWSTVHMCGYGIQEPVVTVSGVIKSQGNVKSDFATYLLDSVAVEKIRNGAVDGAHLDGALVIKILKEKKMGDLLQKLNNIETITRRADPNWANMLLIETVMCLIILALASVILH